MDLSNTSPSTDDFASAQCITQPETILQARTPARLSPIDYGRDWTQPIDAKEPK